MTSKTKKKCANCGYGCCPPASMKPMYGSGGMMLVCCKPRKRNKSQIIMVAPEYKCRDWKVKEEDTYAMD